jgi:hypothetical protein
MVRLTWTRCEAGLCPMQSRLLGMVMPTEWPEWFDKSVVQ